MPRDHIRSYLLLMSETHPPTGHWHEAGQYEALRGTSTPDGPRGSTGLPHQRATAPRSSAARSSTRLSLRWVLQRVRDLALPLVSVIHVEPRSLTGPALESDYILGSGNTPACMWDARPLTTRPFLRGAALDVETPGVIKN